MFCDCLEVIINVEFSECDVSDPGRKQWKLLIHNNIIAKKIANGGQWLR